MAPSHPSQALSHDPPGRIAQRFEATFEAQVTRNQLEPYPALNAAWEEALEYHRTLEVDPMEHPQGARVRDTICRLFSLLPDPRQACRMAARMAAMFAYPQSGRTRLGIRAFSQLAMLCHAAVREPGHCELRFGEANPGTYAAELRRGQRSFHHVELSRLLNFLSRWPQELVPPRNGSREPPQRR